MSLIIMKAQIQYKEKSTHPKSTHPNHGRLLIRNKRVSLIPSMVFNVLFNIVLAKKWNQISKILSIVPTFYPVVLCSSAYYLKVYGHILS